jgi:hypothetical protein
MSRQRTKHFATVVPASVSFPPHQVEQLLLDIPSAAKALSSTVWTVRGLHASKKLRFFKLGRRFVVDIADIRAFIDTQKRENAA